MKSLGFRQQGGNVNLHGKKTKRLACKCCTMVDVREKVLAKEHRKEMLPDSLIGRTQDSES